MTMQLELPSAILQSLPEDNKSRCALTVWDWLASDRDVVETASSLATNGWLQGKPVTCRKATPEEINSRTPLVDERFDEWLATEKAYNIRVGTETKTVTGGDIAKAFREAYTHAGKAIKAKLYGVDCHRRRLLAAVANAARAKAGLDPIQIPINVVEFANKFEEIKACGLENLIQRTGVKPLTMADMLKVGNLGVSVFVGTGESIETILGRMGFNRGQQQKIGEIIWFDREYPQEKFIEKLLDRETAGDPKRPPCVSKLRAAKLREMHGANVSEVRAYMLNPTEEIKTKAASGKDMNAVADKTPNLMVKEVLRAAVSNTLSSLDAHTNLAPQHNVLWENLKSRDPNNPVVRLADALLQGLEVEVVIREPAANKS